MNEQTAPPPAAATKSLRLSSLDAFRGITIAGMIIVNNPGTWRAVYPPLLHAEWHGWTPTDLIFPFFLFIVGVAMAFSFTRRIAAGASRSGLARHVLQRSLIIFTLGMILTGLPDFDYSQKLILDVLQRIAVVYLFSGLIVVYTSSRTQAILSVVFLVVYWLLMVFISVPGYGRGVLGPQGNVWQYVDQVLLKGWHYHAEGILSLIPSFSTVLLGTLTGEWLRSSRSHLEKAAGLFVAGNIGLVLGLILHQWFPINKLLWSSSYVVFTAGFALNLLGMCYWAIEIKRWTAWSRPFVIFGMNAIAAFFLSSLTSRLMGMIRFSAGSPEHTISLKGWIFATVFASWLNDINASLFFALCYTLLWLGVMSVLYRKQIFVKV